MQDTVTAVGAALAMFAVFLPLTLTFGEKHKKTVSLIFKGLCTGVAVLLGILGAWRSGGSAASWWMAAGLSVCLVADIAIGIHFVSGVLAFLLGHVCYINAFRLLAPFSIGSVPVFILTLAVFLLIFVKKFDKMGNAKIPLIIYAAVISAMLALAVMLPAALGTRGWLTAAGAVLFVVSDILLGRNMYFRCTRFSNAFSLTCYYAGQYLLALSVFLPFAVHTVG